MEDLTCTRVKFQLGTAAGALVLKRSLAFALVVGLTIVGAKIKVIMPGTPVPMTLQVLFVRTRKAAFLFARVVRFLARDGADPKPPYVLGNRFFFGRGWC